MVDRTGGKNPAMSFTTRFRQPEYIGENRCFPCTLVNVGIAVVVSIVVGLWMAGAGAMVLLSSLGSIYFRGYLVPGTPTLTKTHLPDRSCIREYFLRPELRVSGRSLLVFPEPEKYAIGEVGFR